ncbi:rRNA (cytosine-C(5))-methyltransferase NOP2C [Syzygium oleosum]|uniref:rRNA (cytosine-C(5))-methyltransferase NOP2C n=1 Tax=Syzygium oleosum TaxID=219896 RepID=UPI0024B991FD|nr:rRNA (cytosine-C(5))-methyltransferase NOP2C [Syzygium oleosum]
MRSDARRLLQNLRGRRPLFTSRNPPASPMDRSERYCFNPALRWDPRVEAYFIEAYGAEHFARISAALTRPSCYSCIRVNTLKSTSDAVIEKMHAIAEEAGLGDSTDQVNSQGTRTVVDADKVPQQNGALTNANGDTCLEGQSKKVLGSLGDAVDPNKEGLPSSLISKCDIPGLDYVVFIRGSGPHDIDYGYALDKPPKEVMVSRKCAEAVLRGAQVYVPGALACSAHVEKGDVVAVSVAVEQPGPDGGWGVNMTRGTVLQGFQTDPLYNERNGMYIGQGVTMMSRAGIFRASEGVAVDMKSRVYRLPSFNDVLEGEIFLQNLPSIITAHALDPRKGERILDMCAAPGGKTTAIAILMKDEGEIVAADRSHNKVLDVQKLAAELGLNCITTYKLDALKSVCKSHELSAAITSNSGDSFRSDATNQNSSTVESQVEKVQAADIAGLSTRDVCNVNVRNEKSGEKTYASRSDVRKSMRRMRNGPGRNQCKGIRAENSKGFLPHSFDRVLLDAPCSALGLRPRLFSGEETLESLRSHAKYQRRMFDQAVQLVRPGGVIVYSTCTINPGENEALVRYALDTYKFLSLAPQHPRVGGSGLVGSFEYTDGYIEEWLKPGEEELVQRFDPSAPLDTIGFFIAKFIVNKET